MVTIQAIKKSPQKNAGEIFENMHKMLQKDKTSLWGKKTSKNLWLKYHLTNANNQSTLKTMHLNKKDCLVPLRFIEQNQCSPQYATV